jgi:hypothetical protein
MSNVEKNSMDDYVCPIDIDYDVDLLKSEIDNYLDLVLRQDPDYGKFIKDTGEMDKGTFRYLRIMGNDLDNLKYTNYIKTYLEDELEIDLDKNIPITRTQPFKKALPHRDGNDNMCFTFAINFPLFKEDKGTTNFWELDNTSDVRYNHLKNGIPTAGVSSDSPTIKEVLSIKMDGPKLIRTEKYHSVDNSLNENYRMNLSFRMHIDNQIKWEEILHKVKRSAIC